MPKNFRDLDYDPFFESAAFVFGSLEEAMQTLAECVTGERASGWKIGAVVAGAVDSLGRYGVYKKLAGVAFYTSRRLKTFEALHRTFPPEVRYPDQPLFLYEVALLAEDPVSALEDAVAEGLSPKELKALLAPPAEKEASPEVFFDGEAVLLAYGPDWRITIDAGKPFPGGEGAHSVSVRVTEIKRE